MNEFKKLGLSDITIDALQKKGFEKPSPIQAKTIPVLLKGEHDVIGQAQTGTGKTACFALPILENLEKGKHVQALILAPTRELAVQVATEIKSLSGKRDVRVTTIYGGASIRTQMDELKRGVEVVVGTPGRVIDLINRGNLKINNISYAVLDEADEMLNMGFVDDIKDILSQTNKDKKMLLFSATMPKEILGIAKKFMREYEIIEVENQSLATDLIDQVYFSIASRDRYAAVRRIIGATPDFHGIIFCKTRREVDTLAHKLIGDNYAAAALHGDVSQAQRENFLQQFKSKKLNVLIATDVAARGIDVNDLNVVINYSLPQSPETYVHRIGRTGRAGNRGTAVTLLIPSESRRLKFVEKIIDQKIPKGELPSVNEIIEAKKSQIEETISKILESDKKTEFNEIAKNLLNGNNAEKVVASVLRYAFSNELDSNKYKEIRQVSEQENSGSGEGRSRSRGGRRSGSRGRDSGRGRSRSEGRSRDSGRRSDGRNEPRDKKRSSSRSGSGRRSRSEGGRSERRNRDSGRGRSESRSKNSRRREARYGGRR